MQRGHAEALMPLIKRVMERARLDLRRSRPHRRHHRARQLHRPARRHRRGARARARRRQAGGRAHRRSRPTPRPSSPPTTRCRWWRRSTRATITSICRCSAPAAARWWRRGSRRCAKRCARRRAARRAWSATRPRLLAGGLAGRRKAAEQGRAARRARHRLGGAARRRRRRNRQRRPSRSICARPTRSRRTPANWRADDGLLHATCSRAPSRCCRRRAARDAAAIAALHAASFRRGWSEQEVEGLLLDRHVIAHRAMLGGKLVGFIMSRLAADEAEILSVAVAARQPRPRAGAPAADPASAAAGGLERARGIPGSGRAQYRRRSGSTIAPAFARWRAGPIIIPGAGGKPATALVLRRDLA